MTTPLIIINDFIKRKLALFLVVGKFEIEEGTRIYES